jgi:hypothetical protein
MIYDFVDTAFANELGIDVSEYIVRVESLLEKHPHRGEVLIGGIWSEDDHTRERAKKMFMEATAEFIS